MSTPERKRQRAERKPYFPDLGSPDQFSQEARAWFKQLMSHPEDVPPEFWRIVLDKQQTDGRVNLYQIEGLGVPKEYVPVWTSSGTAPALGNGTLTGRYVRVGKFVYVTIKWTAGSTTTFGTGLYEFSLPVTANITHRHLGHVAALDLSANQTRIGFAQSGNGTAISVYNFADPPTAFWGQLVPVTWANGDVIDLALAYEAA